MAASIREIDNIDIWCCEWENYEENLEKLKENEFAKLITVMDEYHNAQSKLQKCVDMQEKNLKAFGTSLKRIKQLQRSDSDKENICMMEQKMNGVSGKFHELRQALPKTAGWFLRACIGEINVSLYMQKRHYKDVYEKFKLKTMMMAMGFAIINLFFLHTRFVDALFNGILVWYYSSLTLQEQILRANGSRIKGWYVTHHYLSILVSGFLLIWPSGVSYQLFRTQFYCFVLYLSFVQCLQYYYQSGVLYKLRALGHGSTMDTTEDGIRSWMLQRLKFLVPFLVVAYIFQIYNAYTLYWISKREECREWQVMASAIVFLIIGLGNSFTLVIVLRQKVSGYIRFPCL